MSSQQSAVSSQQSAVSSQQSAVSSTHLTFSKFFIFLTLLLALVPLGVLAAPGWARVGGIPYREASWDDTTKTVTYTDRTAADATAVTSDTTTWTNGWYYVSGDVTIETPITVTGTVKVVC